MESGEKLRLRLLHPGQDDPRRDRPDDRQHPRHESRCDVHPRNRRPEDEAQRRQRNGRPQLLRARRHAEGDGRRPRGRRHTDSRRRHGDEARRRRNRHQQAIRTDAVATGYADGGDLYVDGDDAVQPRCSPAIERAAQR